MNKTAPIPKPLRLSKYSYPALKQEYLDLWNMIEIQSKHLKVTDIVIDRIFKNRSRYEKAVERTLIPWWFIGIVHFLESGGSFNGHLHNGDPLSAKTKNVPAGRPIAPPNNGNSYTWEESAADAIKYTGLDKVENWSISMLLYRGEKYNGFGYRRQGVHTPYNWSWSNLYTKGRYVKDGVFDKDKITLAPGFAIIIRRMIDRNLIDSPQTA